MKTKILFVIFACAATPAWAEFVFESALLGPTGLDRGASINEAQFLGTRFRLESPATARRIGGHFFGNVTGPGDIFGAIVPLSDTGELPSEFDLSGAQAPAGHTLITLPGGTPASDEFAGDLVLDLDPGHYALLFGSGLFGATGFGGAPRGDPSVGDPSYFVVDDGQIFEGGFSDARFFVDTVPEPSTLVCALIALACYAGFGLGRDSNVV